MLGQVISFEMVLVLYVYSNVFQTILPPLPIDSTVILFVLSIGVGGLVLLRDGIYLRGFNVVVAYLPYLFWAALSLAWTPSRLLVFESLKLLATVDLWMLIVGAMILAHKRTRMTRFLTLTAVLALIVACMGVGVYFIYGSFKYAGWDVGRVYNEWGRAVANGAIVLLVLFLRSRFASARQIVLGGLLAICTVFIFIASSRSALLILAVPTVLFMAVNLAPVGRRGLGLSRAQLLLLMVVAAVVTLVTVLISSGVQIDTVNRLMKVFSQAENTDLILGANRFDYFAAAGNYFAQSPLIGHGVRSFTVLYRGFEMTGVQPHNIFLELLSDTGLVGFTAFGLLLFVALKPITTQRLRADPLLLCVVMLFAGRLTAAMFGQDLCFQNVLFLAIGMLALRPAPAAASEVPEAGQAGEADDVWRGRDIGVNRA